MTIDDIVIRLIRDTDSFEQLTKVLHAAYARLGAMGLNYKAVDQPVEMTRERSKLGECYLAIRDGDIVGTITFMPPSFDDYHPYFKRPDVAVFGQFAVSPELQGGGLGRRMIDFVEARARELGAAEIGCDTAEKADHLVKWYTQLGYREIAKTQWPHARYVSLILGKRL